MRSTIPTLSLAVLLMAGCQPQSNTQATGRASDTVTTTSTSRPATSSTPSRQEQQREADQKIKEKLGAVQDEIVRKTNRSGDASFKSFFQDFEAIVQRQDAAAFNKLIDAQRGLYTIETTGTMPNYYHVTDIAKHRLANFNKPFFSIRETFKNCNLEEVKEFPRVNCEDDNDYFNRKGCFLTDGAEFQEARLHQFASLPEAQNQSVEKTLPLVSKSVLHTASGYKFYFGQINGQWKVLFINLMAPCSA